MNPPVYLKPWLHARPAVARILLQFIMLSGVFQFGVFALSQNFVVSYLGAQPEDVTLALQMTYIGILVMLPIQFRFQRYFQPRNYLIVVISLGIFLAAACMVVQDLILFFIIRFLQGIVVCGMAACMLVHITAYLTPAHRQVTPSVLLYGTVLANAILIGMIASRVTLTGDFQHLYYYIILFLVTSLLIVIFAFKNYTERRPYPLWQIDWAGAVFFVLSAIAMAYCLIYGSKYEWFADSRIKMSAVALIFGLILFLSREITFKRPLIQVTVLKNPKMWLGLMLLGTYYGMKESINLLFGYTSTILTWSPEQTMQLGLLNIAGLTICITISTICLVRGFTNLPMYIVSGFGLLFIYHIWIYLVMTNDLSFEDLMIPFFLQGAASGIMFIPMVIFIVKTATPKAGYTGLVIGAYARFISLLNASAGFFNLQLYFNQQYKESFLGKITVLDGPISERLDKLFEFYSTRGFAASQASALANSALAKTLSMQTQLLTIRAIFMTLSIIAALIMVTALIIIILSAILKSRQMQV
ncbi:MFS transporter [Mucilaginibacter sp. SMC90]|uniref:MFS transporter n=1 Tax=Mucilaginibacter sp. SMC90 TaxID=2929803 RepID=UPI001FB3E9DA|nr:MFS transporter [Mucilaginibacter sp. SMC90]UOE48837.1 MFS transporter [Mucilaginibacter sp. SMC90]